MAGNLNVDTTNFDSVIQTKLDSVTLSTPLVDLIKLYRASELYDGADYTHFTSIMQNKLDATDSSTDLTEILKISTAIGKVSNSNSEKIDASEANILNSVANIPTISSGLPINSLTHLNNYDDAVSEPSGAEWLKTGYQRFDINNYPLATKTYGINPESTSVITDLLTYISDLTYLDGYYYAVSQSRIYKLNLDLTKTGQSFGVVGTGTLITSDGTYFYVLAPFGSTSRLYQYDMSGVDIAFYDFPYFVDSVKYIQYTGGKFYVGLGTNTVLVKGPDWVTDLGQILPTVNTQNRGSVLLNGEIIELTSADNTRMTGRYLDLENGGAKEVQGQGPIELYGLNTIFVASRIVAASDNSRILVQRNSGNEVYALDKCVGTDESMTEATTRRPYYTRVK